MDVAVRCLREGRSSDTGATVVAVISAADLTSKAVVSQVTPSAVFVYRKQV